MSASVEFSVVIPTCNRPEMLAACLDAVHACMAEIPDVGVEVIVSDDSAADQTRTMVASRYAWVQWVQGPRRGPAANRNAGVAVAQGSWIIFTDDDCLPRPNWLSAYVCAIREDPAQNVFEGKTVADRERHRLDEESPLNLYGGFLWSCNMALTRSLFLRLDGFCESFPYPAMEDVDLRLRLLACGERLAFVADSVICHPYRPAKGLKFVARAGASYLQLVRRHPHLLGQAPWRTLGMNLARRVAGLTKDAARCRFRGVTYAIGSLSVSTYFDVIARLRANATTK